MATRRTPPLPTPRQDAAQRQSTLYDPRVRARPTDVAIAGTPGFTPEIVSAVVDQNTLICYFSGALRTGSPYKPDINTFDVRVGINTRIVNSFTILENRVELQLHSSVAAGDYVAISYTPESTTQRLQSTIGVAVPSFISRRTANVTGRAAEPLTPTPSTIPEFISAAIATNTVECYFSTLLREGSAYTPAASRFEVWVGIIEHTITTITITENRITLELADAVAAGDRVWLTYRPPEDTTRIQTPSGTAAPGFVARNAANVTDPAAVPIAPTPSTVPTFVRAGIDGNTIQCFFSTLLRTGNTYSPAARRFEVWINLIESTVSSVTVVEDRVLIALNTPAIAGDQVTLTYRPNRGQARLQTLTGTPAPGFVARPLTNLTDPSAAMVTPTPATIPEFVRVVIEQNTALCFFSSLLREGNPYTPPVTSFEVWSDIEESTVSAVSVTENRVKLTLATTTVAGALVTVTYRPPPADPRLQSPSGTVVPGFVSRPATNVTDPSAAVVSPTATTIPTFRSAVVDGNTILCFFSTLLREGAAYRPLASRFEVWVDVVERSVTGVALSEDRVVLTLSSAVVAGDRVTVTYRPPAGDARIQTPIGTAAPGFVAERVGNATNRVAVVGPTPGVEALRLRPRFSRVSSNLAEMYFETPLDETHVPAVGAFTILLSDGLTNPVTSLVINGGRVRLTLQHDVYEGTRVSLNYIPPLVGYFRTEAGTALAALVGVSLRNDGSADPIKVGILSGQGIAKTGWRISYRQIIAGIPNRRLRVHRVEFAPRNISTAFVPASRTFRIFFVSPTGTASSTIFFKGFRFNENPTITSPVSTTDNYSAINLTGPVGEGIAISLPSGFYRPPATSYGFVYTAVYYSILR